MSDYQAESGETVLLTVRARYVGDGDFAIGSFVTNRVGRHFVSVEPLPFVLPTAFGSRIEATRLVGVDSGTRTALVLAGDRWLAANDEHWYEADELADVEVLHDPDATGPTVEADAPEPVGLPTGLGAVVLAQCGQWYGAAVRAHIGIEEEWVFTSTHHSNGTHSYYRILCSDADLSDVAVLSLGVEVELP